jgi:hypothetical protein
MAITHTNRTNSALYDISATQWNTLVDMFVGVGRVIVSDTEPYPAYDGDLWFDPTGTVAPSADLVLEDTFSNSSLDTANFGAITAEGGTVTEGASGLVLDASTHVLGRMAAVYYKTKMTLATTGTWEWWYTIQDADYDYSTAYFFYAQTTAPGADAAATVTVNRRVYDGLGAGTSAGFIAAYHKNAAGTHTADYEHTDLSVPFDTLYGVRFENDATNAQFRMTHLNASGGVIYQTAWIAHSELYSSTGDLWTVFGDLTNDSYGTNRKSTVKRFRHLSALV